MEKGRTLRRWTAVLAVSALLLAFGAAVYGLEHPEDQIADLEQALKAV